MAAFAIYRPLLHLGSCIRNDPRRALFEKGSSYRFDMRSPRFNMRYHRFAMSRSPRFEGSSYRFEVKVTSFRGPIRVLSEKRR